MNKKILIIGFFWLLFCLLSEVQCEIIIEKWSTTDTKYL